MNNIKTKIVGIITFGVIGLTIFCCNGTDKPVEAAPVQETVEEIVPVEILKEEVKEAVEEVLPAESVE